MRGTVVLGKRPLRVTSSARRLPLTNSVTPAHRRVVSRQRQLDHRGRGGDDAPAPGRRPVAEQGALARAQQGGQELPFLGEQFWRHRRVHTRIDAVQLADAQRAADR